MNYERYENGIMVESVPYTEKEAAQFNNNKILALISDLEETQTPRRMREALKDPSWLENLESQITQLRSQLIPE